MIFRFQLVCLDYCRIAHFLKEKPDTCRSINRVLRKYTTCLILQMNRNAVKNGSCSSNFTTASGIYLIGKGTIWWELSCLECFVDRYSKSTMSTQIGCLGSNFSWNQDSLMSIPWLYKGILFKRHDMNWHELPEATCESWPPTRLCTKNAPASEVLECNFVPSDVHKMEYKHHRPGCGGCGADTFEQMHSGCTIKIHFAYHCAMPHIYLPEILTCRPKCPSKLHSCKEWFFNIDAREVCKT